MARKSIQSPTSNDNNNSQDHARKNDWSPTNNDNDNLQDHNMILLPKNGIYPSVQRYILDITNNDKNNAQDSNTSASTINVLSSTKCVQSSCSIRRQNVNNSIENTFNQDGTIENNAQNSSTLNYTYKTTSET
ncbi:4525_t:CDS:2, partial [Gigaspora margarita]